MNLVQTFRRLGQKMTGWNTSLNNQSVQLWIIRRLYANHGLEIKGGGACPEQYEVFKDGKQVAYYRLRHGEFRIDHPNHMGETIYEAEPHGDGIFDDNERLNYLANAMRIVLSKLESTPPLNPQDMTPEQDFWKTPTHEQQRRKNRRNNIIRFVVVSILAFAYFYYMFKYYKK